MLTQGESVDQLQPPQERTGPGAQNRSIASDKQMGDEWCYQEASYTLLLDLTEMSVAAKQTKHWMGEFGREYTDRNALSLGELEAMYKQRYGFERSHLNHMFLGSMKPSISILEVGSNVGDQLRLLQRMGFARLYGIELQRYAAELSKLRTNDIELVQGTVFRIPCRTGIFDLVFTSGLLIHINPSDITHAMQEIHRCSRKYIWGFEYHADKYSEATYRGHKDLLWKADFAKMYLDQFKDLQLVKEMCLKNTDNPDNVDSMFLLAKKVEEPQPT